MMNQWITSIILLIVLCEVQSIKGLQCQRISVVACQGLGYNMTALPNLASHTLQVDAELQITTLLPLLESGCSKHVRFLICASLFPLCSPDVPRPVTACKSLCENVKKDCATEPLLEHLWPEFLNCETLPQPDKQELCMQIPQDEMLDKQSLSTSGIISSVGFSNVALSSLAGDSTNHHPPPPFIWPWLPLKISHHNHHKTLPKIICPTNYTADNENCVPQCDTDVMYTGQQKKIAEAMILALSALCFILTLFSLVTFWAEPTRFGYPERPILYLGLCYNLLSVCYLERIIFHYPAKESVNEENNTCMLSPPCLASYITIGYLTLCAASWWLIFSLSFYLSSNKKWSSEALEKKSGLFHVLAWVPPLAPPIGALLWGAVKPHELTGMCTAPGFVEIPAIILLVTGIIFTEITSKSLKGLQQQMRIQNNDIIRFTQIRKRLLIFSFMFFIPALLAMILSFFERLEIRVPPCLSLETCEHPEKFSSVITLLKLFFHLIGGSLTGMWVWSRKTCESYKSRIISSPTNQSSVVITKSVSSLPKKSNCYNNNGKQITPLYTGINFHNVPIYNGHSRV